MYQKNPVKKLISSTLTFLGCSIAIPTFFTAPANANYVLCTPANVGVFPERTHIRCIQNFAVSSILQYRLLMQTLQIEFWIFGKLD